MAYTTVACEAGFCKEHECEELAQHLIRCLAVECMICSFSSLYQLLPSVRDGVAVAEARLRQISFFFPNMFNVICFISHNVGKHFQFGVLTTFSRYWHTMFFLSPAAPIVWKTRTGTVMCLSSETWWRVNGKS